MKILFAANLSTTTVDASQGRKLSLARMGHEIVGFDTDAYTRKNWLLRSIDSRRSGSPIVERMNSDLLQVAREIMPDVFWADALSMFQPITLAFLQELEITTVAYMVNDTFGSRTGPDSPLSRECLPFFDLYVSNRDAGVLDYKLRGVRSMARVLAGYDPAKHFPSPVRLTDKIRTNDVLFVGSPGQGRATTVERLADAGVAVRISGTKWAWERALGKPMMDRTYLGDELYANAYREAIWRSKINLSFATKSKNDEHAQESFAIAGCAGFQIVERDSQHHSYFIEDEEAVFFSNFEELKSKVERYLPDEAARDRIAVAGHARAVRDGYQHDFQMRTVLDLLDQMLAAKDGDASWPCPHDEGP